MDERKFKKMNRRELLKVAPVLALGAFAIPNSPGTRYRHYSPEAVVLLLAETSTEALQRTVAAALCRHRRVGCLLYRLELGEVPPGVILRQIGGSIGDYARALFAGLRELDALGVEAIIVEGVAEDGLGVAVMDRLRRAASIPPS